MFAFLVFIFLINVSYADPTYNQLRVGGPDEIYVEGTSEILIYVTEAVDAVYGIELVVEWTNDAIEVNSYTPGDFFDFEANSDSKIEIDNENNRVSMLLINENYEAVSTDDEKTLITLGISASRDATGDVYVLLEKAIGTKVDFSTVEYGVGDFKELNIVSKPNVEVTALGFHVPSITPTVNYASQMFTTIANSGATETGAFRISYLEIDGTLYGQTLIGTYDLYEYDYLDVTNLGPGESIDDNFDWEPTSTDDAVVCVLADSADIVDESEDESYFGDILGADHKDNMYCTANLQIDECMIDSDCDDRVFCNGEETCEAAVCMPGTPPDCDDGIDCTDDSCDDDCSNTPNDANCAAGESCAPEYFGEPTGCGIISECTGQPDGTACDDGIYCNGPDQCSASSCINVGPVIDCSDGVDCTMDSCNEATDTCDNPVDINFCDDGDACTEDRCSTGGCQYTDICPTDCGNNVIEDTEECDGTDLGRETCESLGHDGGELSCGDDCLFNIAGCWDDACEDSDGDGWSPTDTSCNAEEEIDCDDSNPTVYPGADHVCDGIDNNCDGLIDNIPIANFCGQDICLSDEEYIYYYCGGEDGCLSATITCPTGYICDEAACIPDVTPEGVTIVVTDKDTNEIIPAYTSTTVAETVDVAAGKTYRFDVYVKPEVDISEHILIMQITNGDEVVAFSYMNKEAVVAEDISVLGTTYTIPYGSDGEWLVKTFVWNEWVAGLNWQPLFPVENLIVNINREVVPDEA